MKILCDVCDKGEASLYCIADEAALCAACDHRVHHANKLAGKHHRFSLLNPSPKTGPLCDICQERSAFLFCLEDRAILCRECDIPIHKANQHTQKHTRFLLTGVRISAAPTLYSESAAESASSNLSTNGAVLKSKTAPTCTTPPAKGTTTTTTTAAQEASDKSSSNLQFSTSSISEYLIETLPGWHVEDLLDSSSPSPSAFFKSGENDLVLPFWDGEIQSNNISKSGFSTENMGFWVPQVQVHQTQNQSFQSSLDNNNNNNNNTNYYHYNNSSSNNNVGFGLANGCRDQFKEISNKSTRKRSEDKSFAVPQISPSSSALSKRSKQFW